TTSTKDYTTTQASRRRARRGADPRGGSDRQRGHDAREPGLAHRVAESGDLDLPVRRAVLAEQLEKGLRREGLGAEHPGALPDAATEQLARDGGVDRSLPDDGLAGVLAHRLLVVDDVVEVRRTAPAVLAGAPHPGARAGASAHPLAERRGVG